MEFSISESNFEDRVIKAEVPVVVDCYTDWCMPCKALKPLLKEIVDEMSGKVNLGFLNLDDNPRLAEKLKITAVPKVLIYSEGEIKSKIVGIMPKEEYSTQIKEVVDGISALTD